MEGLDWLTGAGSGFNLAGSGLNTAGIPAFDTSWLPAASAAADTASSAGGAGGSWFADIMSGLGTASKAAIPLIGLGTTGLGLYSGIKGMQEAANIKERNEAAFEQQQQAAQTALGSGTALTTAGTSAMMGGPLPEGLEAQAQQWEDAYRAQVRNYLAKLGGTTSSAATQWEPYIKQQAAIYRQQLAQGLMQPGQTGLQIASGAASRTVGQNQATQTGLGTALEAANRALATLQAASGERDRYRP